MTARTDILVTAGLGWTELKLVAAFISTTLILARLPAAAITQRLRLSDLRA